MTIDDASKYSQIGFYLVIAILSTLTFIRAKKGLLSPVNTEYHKKVIDRLELLSKTLLDEYDWESPNHWSKRNTIGEIVKEINTDFENNKEWIIKNGEFHGMPVHPDYMRLLALVQQVKSDPFIPKLIREKVTELLETRANVISSVHHDHIEKYQKELAEGRYTDELDRNANWIHNNILEDLNERGCGITQIEAEVHEIRFAIQSYFEKFDPDA